MSRGPTRRLRALIESGVVPAALVRAAEHEADLLAHPYIAVEHVELARLRLAGETSTLKERLAAMSPGVRRRWWRPRGRRSALRRSGLAATRAAQRAAQRGHPDSWDSP